MRELKEELRMLHEPGSYVGEVVKLMSKKKILVKVQPEGKYVVEASVYDIMVGQSSVDAKMETHQLTVTL